MAWLRNLLHSLPLLLFIMLFYKTSAQTCNAANDCCNKGKQYSVCCDGHKTCKACPTGRYQNQNNKPYAACAQCTKCGVGQKQTTPCSTSADIVCGNCDAGKYQALPSFTGTSCTPCTGCAAGQKYTTQCSTSADNGVCGNCGDDEYQEESAFTGTSCTPCTKCGVGQKIKYDITCLTSRNSECENCGAGQYQASSTFTGTSCTPCTGCGAGKKQTTQCSTSADNRVCGDCDAGQYQASSTFTGTSCTPCTGCVAGKKLVSLCDNDNSDDGVDRDTNICDDCDDDQYQASSSFTGTSCTPCTKCGVGKKQTTQCSRSADIVCGNCDAGQYQALSSFTGASCTPCTGCSAGKKQTTQCSTSADNGVCGNCDAGQYQASSTFNGTSCTPCTGCVAGKKQTTQCSTSADIVCGNCDAGKYQALPSFTGTSCTPCTGCVAGKKQTTQCSTSADDSVCENCDAGQYQASSTFTGTSCTSCDKGKYATSATVSSCSGCEIGKYQELEVNTEYDCKFCAAGFAFKTKEEECDACISGKYQDKTDNTHLSTAQREEGETVACKSCGEGQYAVDATFPCQTCDIGKYQDEVNTKYDCKVCEHGTISIEKGQSQCKKCGVGTFLEDGKDLAPSVDLHDQETDCKDCPKGYFNPLKGAAICFECSSAKQTKTTSCLGCLAGTFKNSSRDESLGLCQPCILGKYTDVVDLEECIGCPKGWFGNSFCSNALGVVSLIDSGVVCEGRTYVGCKACSRGKIGSMESATTADQGCNDCPKGTYSTTEGLDLTACEFCPLGQYNVNTGSAKPSDCKDCKAGKYANSIIRPATTSSASPGTSTGGTFAQYDFSTVATAGTGTGSSFTKHDFSSGAGAEDLIVVIDGTSATYSVVADCTSLSACATALNTQIAGASVAEVSGNLEITDNLEITSDTTGVSSTVAITTVGSGTNALALFGIVTGGYSAIDGIAATAEDLIVVIDGTSATYSVVADCTSLSACATALNTQIAGASVTEVSGNLEIASDTTGVSSTVGITTVGSGTNALAMFGTVTAFGGSETTCLDCEIGKYNENSGLSNDGKDGCLECPTGFYQGKIGQTFCLPCLPGRYVAQTGQNDCKNCEKGSADKEQSRKSECTSCKAGLYAKDEGRTTCIQCEVGKYKGNQEAVYIYDQDGLLVESESGYFYGNDEPKTFSCNECPKGFYAKEPESKYCQSCTKGQYANARGQSECLECGYGSASNSARTITECHQCQPGTYQGKRGKTSCLECPIGKRSETGAVSCQECPVGKAGIAGGSCAICHAGFYRGNTEIKNDTSGICEQCPTGFFVEEAQQAFCLKCDAGTYTDQKNSTICLNCPSSWFQIDKGKDKCIACIPGQANDPDSTSRCIACEVGMFSKISATETCLPCPLLLVQPLTSSTECVPCTGTKIPNIAATACEKPPWKTVEDCKKDEYLNDTNVDKNQHECTKCPIGANCEEDVTLTTLQPLDGYWRIPKTYIPNENLYVKCPYPKDCEWCTEAKQIEKLCTKKNTSCVHHTEGIVCSQCKIGYDRISSLCTRCGKNEIGIRVFAMFCISCFVIFGLYWSRKKLIRLHSKYKSAWRQVTLSIKIVIAFAQISLSLPTMLSDFEFPPAYILFLNRFAFVNVDFASIIGMNCVVRVDFRISLLVSLIIPISIVIISTLIYAIELLAIRRTSKLAILIKNKTTVMTNLFDLADFDEDNQLNSKEVLHLMKTIATGKLLKRICTLSPKTIEQMMIKAGAKKSDRGRGELNLKRDKFVVSVLSHAHKLTHTASRKKRGETANANDNVPGLGEFISVRTASHFWEESQLISTYLSVMVNLLLVLHAPLSAKSFQYFDCHYIGEKRLLRQDYDLDCDSDRYYSYLPSAILLLFGFAILFPVALIVLFYAHRNDLHTPRTRLKFGWLYILYTKKAPWWDIHELFRKMILTGLLVYFKPSTRSPVAILICMFVTGTLNYFKPHKNKLVFWIAQGSFTFTGLKYVLTVFFAASKSTPLNSQELEWLTYCLIASDVCFFVAGNILVIMIFILLRNTITSINNDALVDEKDDEDDEEDEEDEVGELTNGDKTVVHNSANKFGSKLSRVTPSHLIHKAVLHNQVENVQIKFERHNELEKLKMNKRREASKLRIKSRLEARISDKKSAKKKVILEARVLGRVTAISHHKNVNLDQDEVEVRKKRKELKKQQRQDEIYVETVRQNLMKKLNISNFTNIQNKFESRGIKLTQIFFGQFVQKLLKTNDGELTKNQLICLFKSANTKKPDEMSWNELKQWIEVERTCAEDFSYRRHCRVVDNFNSYKMLNVIACSIMAFGPISTIAYLLVSKRSHLAIIAVVGSFFWMLSNVLSAILWVAIPPLKNNWGWIIPSGVAVQELMRYLFYYVYQHSETAIVKAMNDPRTKVPLNDLSSSFSAGVGYGLMQSIVIFGSVLENGFGEGTYYTTECSSMSLFTLTAFTTCFVSISQICWMVIGFNGYRNKSGVRIGLLILLHLGSSMTSLLNQQPNMCIVSVIVQCVVMFISVACAVISQRNAVLKQGERVRV